MRGVLILSAILLQAAPKCGQPTAPGPDSAYRQFAKAANTADARTGWPLLSKATQAELDKRAAALGSVGPAGKPIDGKTMAFGLPMMARPEIKSIKVTEDGADRARLDVTDSNGGAQTIVTVREDGQWRIDLTEQLSARK